MRLHLIAGATAAAFMLVLTDVSAAQSGLSIQAGAGAVYNHRDGRIDDTQRHATASIEYRPPLSPLGIRGDVIRSGGDSSNGRLSYTVNGVLDLGLPLLHPYVTAGWGRYRIGDITEREGYNAGAGARLQLGPIGVYGEVRRHWALGKDLATVGIALR